LNLSTTTPSELYERRSHTACNESCCVVLLPFNRVWGAAGLLPNSFVYAGLNNQHSNQTNLKQIV
jgi:hypothetical protein